MLRSCRSQPQSVRSLSIFSRASFSGTPFVRRKPSRNFFREKASFARQLPGYGVPREQGEAFGYGYSLMVNRSGVKNGRVCESSWVQATFTRLAHGRQT